MEFVSLGGLLPGIGLDDIMMGVSVCRNQNLANVFYRLRLIEAYGTGIQKIMQAYEKVDQKPVLEVTGNAFKITLPNCNFRQSQEQTEDKASDLYQDGEGETGSSNGQRCRKCYKGRGGEQTGNQHIYGNTSASENGKISDAEIIWERKNYEIYFGTWILIKQWQNAVYLERTPGIRHCLFSLL